MPNTQSTPLFALTGSIGTGKSEVLTMLKVLGAATISADELAREAVKPGEHTLVEIVKLFGSGILTSPGELDRRKLATIIFSDQAKRAALEAIIHPRIRELFLEKVSESNNDQAPLIIYEIPLYFESGYSDPKIKGVIVVTAPEELCIQRIINRDGLSADDARKRLSAQLPQADKIRRSDYVINNTGSTDELREAVEELYKRLTSYTLVIAPG